MTKLDNSVVDSWFYEINGERKGAVTEKEMISLLDAGVITYGTLVWQKGFPEWMKVENTQLSSHLPQNTPPPLVGDSVNNTVIWILAFAPLIGFFIELFVAAVVYDGNEYRIQDSLVSSEFWFITVILNIALSIFDSKRLKKAGHDIDKFKGWVWLIPVYMFQRAKNLKQNNSYFIVWIVSFILMLVAPYI